MEQLHYTYENQNAGIAIEQSVYRTGSYHYNWHPEMEFLVVLRGEIEVCSQLACRILREDDVILINPNSGHATFSREPGSVVMVLHTDPRFLSRYFEDFEHFSFEVCSGEGHRSDAPFCALRRQLARIAGAARADSPEKRLTLDSAFYSLMDIVITAFPPQRVPSASFQADGKKMEAMNAILQYIHQNYRQKIRLDSLAKASGYNTNYLSQLFKSNLGINFYDYLTRIRLREATRQLSQTEEKILDIALENGFADLKSFNSVFRKTFRKSPSEYRRQIREDHLRSDLLFKKEFLSSDDPMVCEKLAQYRGEPAPAPDKTQRAAPDAAEALHRQLQSLLREAQAFSDHAAETEQTLLQLWPNCTKETSKKEKI